MNLVNGGADVVNGLCEHPDIKGVSFVGSTPVAKHVYRTAAHAGKRVQALGGAKNFIVVMADADLDKSIGNVVGVLLRLRGRALPRGLDRRDRGRRVPHAAVRERLVAAAKAIKVGDGLEPGVTMGPVIREAARARILSYIEKGLAEGAELLLDGRGLTVKGRENGFFLGPTIFDEVSPKSAIGREEIFGPVLSLMNVPDLAGAIALVHDHPQANATSIYTSSGTSARTFASQAPPSMVGVNIGVAAPMSFFPFGGSKESFFGGTSRPTGATGRLLHGAEGRHRELVVRRREFLRSVEERETRRRATALRSSRRRMARNVTVGLIQTHNAVRSEGVAREVQKAALDVHIPLIDEAGKKGVQILGLQEIFNGPYFCPSQDPFWYDATEAIPGPTTELMQALREEVPDGDGRPALRARAGRRLLQHRRRHRRRRHVPRQVPEEPHPAHERSSGRSSSSSPGNLGYPVFQTRYAKVGVYICYDRHFPEGARALGLNGAEIVFNPSATVAGLSQYLWKLEQPAHAVANGYFVAASNRVGTEAPWNIGKFYGTSYIVDPRGKMLVATRSEDKDELVIARATST